MKPDAPPALLCLDPSPLAVLAARLKSRRGLLLEAWRKAVGADPELTTSDDLSRTQFFDHIPQVLAEFEKSLLHTDDPAAAAADAESASASVEHGRHRWVQGYDLREVIMEWGHLQRCLLKELETARQELPDFSYDTFFSAGGLLAGLIQTAIADSAEQFAALQQKDSIRARNELEGTVARFIDNTHLRAKLWSESSHDLRGQLSIVTSATSLLEDPHLDGPMRAECFQMLKNGTRALKEMLLGMLENTQVEACREERRLGIFDAAILLGGLCAASQPLARERRLLLRTSGQANLPVEGDQGKVQRIAQNLVLNALNHTPAGLVTVSWRQDGPERWSFEVRDTGPGLPAHVSEAVSSGQWPPSSSPGSGLGLSIVHRLSELLGAHLHMETEPEAGTTFTVSFPQRYTA